jgi:hypothetical protein
MKSIIIIIITIFIFIFINFIIIIIINIIRVGSAFRFFRTSLYSCMIVSL